MPCYNRSVRTFYQLLANTVIAMVTNMTVWFAVIFYVYLQTQAVLATSIISGIYLATVAITGFWFGSIVDHNKKKKVMIASSLVSLLMYVIGFLLYITAAPGTYSDLANPMLWVFVVLLLFGVIAGNIRSIALQTAVTFMVKEDVRDKANGMVGTANGVGFLITSMISGFLVGHSGMYGVLLLAVVLTLAAILHLITIEMPEKGIAHVEHAEQPKSIDIPGTLKAINKIPGLLALILFATFNNFLGGVFMSLMDAYGLSLVSVQFWGVLWGVLSLAFIVGGIAISKWGLGKNPLRSLLMANVIIWTISCVFTLYPSIWLLAAGMFIYLSVIPYIEASEHTIIQKVVPAERQGRVFGFAQSVEQAASPITSFAIGPLAQFFFIPFMTTGLGAQTIGSWFGTGPDRGIALVFTLAGIIGLCSTLAALNSRAYKQLSRAYTSTK